MRLTPLSLLAAWSLARRLVAVLSVVQLAGTLLAEPAAAGVAAVQVGGAVLAVSERGFPVSQPVPRLSAAYSNLVKDSIGRIYTTRGGAVFCFDGAAWSELRPAGVGEIQDIAIDGQDRLWVGMDREIGCFSLLPDGTRSYESLTERIPPEHRDYGNLWSVHALGDCVYFTADTRVLELRDGKFTVHPIPSGRRLFSSSGPDGCLYVHSRGYRGLLRFPKDGGAPDGVIPNEALLRLVSYNAVVRILPAANGDRLLCFSVGGCLLWKPDGLLEPTGWPINSFLAANNIEDATVLSDGTYLFGTLHAGAVQVDRQGRVLSSLNKANGGLPSDHVISLLEVAPGRAWVSSLLGVVEWDLRPGLSVHDNRSGLTGMALALTRFKGRLVFGADTDLQVLQPSGVPGRPGSFHRVADGMGYASGLAVDGDWLISANMLGAFAFRGDLGRPFSLEPQGLPLGDFAGCVAALPWGRERLLVATSRYLYVFLGKERGRSFLRRVPLSHIRWLFPDPSDPEACIVRTSLDEVLRVYPNSDDKPAVPLYSPQVSRRILQLLVNGDRLVAHSETGLWSLAPGASRFVQLEGPSASPRLWSGGTAGGPGWVLRNSIPRETPEQPAGTLVLHDAVADPAIGWRDVGTPRAVLPPIGRLRVVHADGDGVLWLCGTERILRVDTQLLPAAAPIGPGRVHWTRFTVDGLPRGLPGGAEASLPGDASLEFAWCAPEVGVPGARTYEVSLHGPGRPLVGLTQEPSHSFSNLPPGDYCLEVRCRTPLAEPGAPAVLRFSILPLWHQTWQARCGLLLLVGVGLLGLLKWNTRLMRRRQRELEAAVLERTQELQASNSLLTEATHAKTQFVRTVSHELRNPIAGARMMAEILVAAPIPQEQRTQAEKLRGCMGYLHRLLDNTLDLSRLELGQVPYTLTRFELKSLLRDTCALFEALGRGEALRLVQDFGPEPELWCLAESTHLQRVLVNFLGNAFKFTASGQVSLRSRALPAEPGLPYRRFEVCDTGPGVPVELRDRLFEPFMRGGIPALDGSSQGAGLGLALSKRLADLSGARIGHTPREGGGSCFWVEWPLLPASADPEATVDGAQDFSDLRVLVVEDDPLQRDALGQFLEQLGVAAQFAADAVKAEKFLCSQSFELVLLDFNLGAHTALSLLKACEAARFGGHPRPRCVLITAHDPAAIAKAALEAGIETLHRKPLSLSDLYGILAAARPAQAPKSNLTSP